MSKTAIVCTDVYSVHYYTYIYRHWQIFGTMYLYSTDFALVFYFSGWIYPSTTRSPAITKCLGLSPCWQFAAPLKGLPATTKSLSWSPRRPFACALEGLGSYYEVFELVSKVIVCLYPWRIWQLLRSVCVCLRDELLHDDLGSRGWALGDLSIEAVVQTLTAKQTIILKKL